MAALRFVASRKACLLLPILSVVAGRQVSALSTMSKTIPSSLAVPPGFGSGSISSVLTSPLTPLDLVDGIQTKPNVTTTEMIAKHTKLDGSIAFVVRRPGWVLCREEGQMLSNLVSANNLEKNFGVFGIIKEIGVDDEGLLEFSSKYFTNYPLYLDPTKQFYAALGDNKLGLPSWNPLRLYRGMKQLGRRMKEKNIEGNMKGEGLKQGGIIIFDSNGEPKAVYKEKTGSEIPVSELLEAISAIQKS